MSAAWGPYAAALLLLAYAGAPKIIRPDSTVRAARDLGIPLASNATVRLFGLAEVALAIAGFAIGGAVGGAVVAALVAAIYVAFAAVTTVGVVRPGVTSCGCFSGDDSPPSVRHVIVDLALAGFAVAVAVTGTPSIVDIVQQRGAGTAAALFALAIIDALLAYVVLARFPDASGSAIRRATLWSDGAAETVPG